MRKWMLWLLLLMVLGVAGYAGYFFGKGKGSAPAVSEADVQGNYHDYPPALNLPKDYVWELSFDQPLDAGTVSEATVFVTDIKQKRVKVQAELASGGKTLRVLPPKEGYREGAYYELYIQDRVQYKEGRREEGAAKLPFLIRREDYGVVEYKEGVIDVSQTAGVTVQGNRFTLPKGAVGKPPAKGQVLLIPTGEPIEKVRAVKVQAVTEQGELYGVTYGQPELHEVVSKIDVYKILSLQDAVVVPGSMAPGLELQPMQTAVNTLPPAGKGGTAMPKLLSATATSFTVSQPEVRNKGGTGLDIGVNGDGAWVLKFNSFTLRKNNHDFVMDGEVSLNPDFLFDADFELGQLKRLTVGQDVTTEQKVQLSVVKHSAGPDYSNVQLKQKLFALQFPISGILTGTLEFYAYVEWDYKKSQPLVRVAAKQKAGFGVHVSEGEVKPFSHVSHEESAKLGGQFSFEARDGIGGEIIANVAKLPVVGVEGNGGVYVQAKAAAGVEGSGDVRLSACLQAEVGTFFESKANLKVAKYFRNDARDKGELSYEILKRKFPGKKLADACSVVKGLEAAPKTLRMRPGEEKSLSVSALVADSYELETKKVKLLEKEETQKRVSFQVSDSSVLTVTPEGKVRVNQNAKKKEAVITVLYQEGKKQYETKVPVEISLPFNLKAEDLAAAKRFGELYGQLVHTIYQFAEQQELPPFASIVPALERIATQEYIQSDLKRFYEHSKGVLDTFPLPGSDVTPLQCEVQSNSVHCRLLDLNVESGNSIYDAYMVQEAGVWKISKTIEHPYNEELTVEMAQAVVAGTGRYRDIFYLGDKPSAYGGKDYLFEVRDVQENRTKRVLLDSSGATGVGEVK
ncbi:Ig-like domain-containing protein [Ectobacillus ponti]|uniref:SbsA Ig-like domain-containing protein n=1 Tax=Ectobacillus ponti TaxID=2961894 RepID=A0AA42BUZ1_9BACI|nr:hypothetical protein [Ectobacillus ponti]MCP8971038.1 hypothetical protein [Ectobacillus ponti]